MTEPTPDWSAEAQDGKWHMSKGVPIGIVLFLLLQTIGLGYWGATLAGNIKANKSAHEKLNTEYFRTVAQMTVSNQRQWDRMNTMADSTNELTAQMAGMKASQEHIIKQLDRILLQLTLTPEQK